MTNQIDHIVRAYYTTFNAGDEAAFLDLLAEDVLHDINQGKRETGKVAFGDFLAEMRRCYRETISDLVIMTEPEGIRAAAEFVVNGEYLQAGPGMPEAKGQKYTLPAGAFFTIRGGKIARISSYYNLSAWLASVSS